MNPGEGLSSETVKAFHLLIKERARQINQEGYTPARDDEHTEGQLALLAAAYALSSCPENDLEDEILMIISFLPSDWRLKPKDAIRDLERAGALIVAELERRLRFQNQDSAG